MDFDENIFLENIEKEAAKLLNMNNETHQSPTEQHELFDEQFFNDLERLANEFNANEVCKEDTQEQQSNKRKFSQVSIEQHLETIATACKRPRGGQEGNGIKKDEETESKRVYTINKKSARTNPFFNWEENVAGP